MKEKWKKCKNYGKYSCSNLGRIRNDFTGRIRNPQPDNTEYVTISLTNNDSKKVHTGVHRIIAETWIPNPENKSTVNHKNRDKTDNRVANLEWATISEQSNHANKTGKKKNKTKNKKGIWKCDKETGEKIQFYDTIREAEEDNNITSGNGNITTCAKGKIKHVYGFQWKYDEKVHFDLERDSLEDEKWKNIMDDYYISNHGRLRNKERLLNPDVNKGYYKCILRGKPYRINRLVAEHFVPNPNKYNVVNHIDGDKLNNHYTNLEWCTHKENIDHAVKLGNNKNVRKVIQYDINYNIVGVYDSCTDAGKQLNIDSSNISRCCKGESNIYDKDKNKLYFKYLEDTDDLENKKIDATNLKLKSKKIKTECKKRKVHVYNKKGKLIDTCETRLDAAKKYNVNRNTITRICNGKVKYSTSNYSFKYAD